MSSDLAALGSDGSDPASTAAPRLADEVFPAEFRNRRPGADPRVEIRTRGSRGRRDVPSLPLESDDDDAHASRGINIELRDQRMHPLQTKHGVVKACPLDHIGGQAVVLPHTAMVAAPPFPMRARCMLLENAAA